MILTITGRSFICNICVDYESGKISSTGAFEAMGDLTKSSKERNQHLLELANRILEKEIPLPEVQTDMDEIYHSEINKG